MRPSFTIAPDMFALPRQLGERAESLSSGGYHEARLQTVYLNSVLTVCISKASQTPSELKYTERPDDGKENTETWVEEMST